MSGWQAALSSPLPAPVDAVCVSELWRETGQEPKQVTYLRESTMTCQHWFLRYLELLKSIRVGVKFAIFKVQG